MAKKIWNEKKYIYQSSIDFNEAQMMLQEQRTRYIKSLVANEKIKRCRKVKKNMSREELIDKEAEVYAWTGNQFDIQQAFKRGAEWADENPNSKHTYTKQQLIDMGFAFTTNGDIVTPDQLNENLKKYLEYKKRKVIEKTCEWLESIDFDMKYWNPEDGVCVDDFIEDLRKVMEE